MILIIAELSLSQCAKYRVWQRVEQMRLLGWDCRWWIGGIRPMRWARCSSVPAWCSIDVPAFASVQVMLEEARRLAVPSWWKSMI
jgi:hypothetical protein